MEFGGLKQDPIDQLEMEFDVILGFKFMEWYIVDAETFPWTCFASRIVPGIELMIHEDQSFEILFFQKVCDPDDILDKILSLPGSEDFLFNMDLIVKRIRIIDGTHNW